LKEKEKSGSTLESMKKKQSPSRSFSRGRNRKTKGGFHMVRINMLSSAGMTKGHGVLSAFEEQTKLVSEGLGPNYAVVINSWKKSDILHFHTINPNYLLRSWFTSAVKVGYVHFLPQTLEGSIRLPRPIQKLLCKYVLLFYKSMDKLIVVNPSFISKLVECGIPAEKIEYIPNFVDDKQFYPMPQDERLKARQAFGLDTEKFTVLCAGQMQKRKGFLDFLETARRCPDMQFVWAGGFSFGKITDGYEEIRHAAEHLPANVTLTGIVPREKMNELYNAADVFFLPSFDELFPMTLLESMCCHKPILVRDLDLYPCILEGYYTAASDVDGFVSQLRALTDPAVHSAAAARSAEGHQRYTKAAVLSYWKNCYASLLPQAQPVPQARGDLHL